MKEPARHRAIKLGWCQLGFLGLLWKIVDPIDESARPSPVSWGIRSYLCSAVFTLVTRHVTVPGRSNFYHYSPFEQQEGGSIAFTIQDRGSCAKKEPFGTAKISAEVM